MTTTPTALTTTTTTTLTLKTTSSKASSSSSSSSSGRRPRGLRRRPTKCDAFESSSFTSSFTSSSKQASPVEDEEEEKEEEEGLTGTTLERLKRNLAEDLTHLFDDVGINPDLYDADVIFSDPLSTYSNFAGYAFNIRMLKSVFKPKYTMHAIEKTNEYEITTRWTMKMYLPSFPFSWNPELTFTGKSVMEMDETFPHKCVKHVDTWDSIENQRYLSPEAVGEVLKQVFNFAKTPENLKTPKYATLRRYRDFEVREYEKFFVAETSVKSDTGSAKMDDSEAGQAFNRLAGYIFGKNERNEKMEMTTPVFSNKSRKMQFVVEESSGDVKPADESVQVRDRERCLFAVASFSGVANKEITDDAEKKLREAMKREASKSESVRFLPRRGDEFVELAQYNDPLTNPVQRRNELLIALDNSRDEFLAV